MMKQRVGHIYLTHTHTDVSDVREVLITFMQTQMCFQEAYAAKVQHVK
jgi:hypothetical protein